MPYVLFVGGVIFCGFNDLFKLRMSNYATALLILSGLLIGYMDGFFLTSLIGFLFGFLFGYAFWMTGGLGGADAKLMGGIGAWLGVHSLLYILLIASFMGLIWAGVVNIKSRGVKEGLKTFKTSMVNIYLMGLKGLKLDDTGTLDKKIPLGMCMAVATVLWIVVI